MLVISNTNFKEEIAISLLTCLQQVSMCCAKAPSPILLAVRALAAHHTKASAGTVQWWFWVRLLGKELGGQELWEIWLRHSPVCAGAMSKPRPSPLVLSWATPQPCPNQVQMKKDCLKLLLFLKTFSAGDFLSRYMHSFLRDIQRLSPAASFNLMA